MKIQHKMEKHLIAIFESVKNSLFGQPKWTGRSIINGIIRFSYKRFGKFIKRYINYNFFALAFNQEFFLKNFLKNILFINCLYTLKHYLNIRIIDVEHGIVDVGCGAAPASIAMFKFFAETLGFKVKVNLVDKSYKQLELARDFCVATHVDIQSFRREVFHCGAVSHNELVLFSYFICEQERSFIRNLFLNRKRFKNGFVVIDYKYVIERIKKYFDRHGDKNIHTIYLCSELPSSISEIISERELYVYGCYYEIKSE